MDTKSLIKTKKPYAKPRMLAERFVPNEYCVACSSNIYKIGEEYVNQPSSIEGEVYYETNNIVGLQLEEDEKVGGLSNLTQTQGLVYDGYFYFNKETLKEGYVKKDIQTVWHVYLFNPLTWEDWDHSWHFYGGTFLSAENREVIVSASS